MALGKRDLICSELGANVFGRLEYIAVCLDRKDFSQARRELIETANFLPGNLVVTIGDDDQRLLDLNGEDQ
jgi:hypothetical protein